MWWIKNPERLATELEAIEELRATEPWLVRMEDTLPEGLLFAVDFDLCVNKEIVPFTLKYPSFFPHTPPSVIPRDGRCRSGHQYGTGGEMCLEYRSDNWDPAVTGAMMIASTYRLLSGEQPSLDERAVVPDAHQVSLRQEIRSARCRFLTTQRFREYAAQLPETTCVPCTLTNVSAPGETLVAYVTSVGPLSKPDWTETEIPTTDLNRNLAVLIRISSLVELNISDYADIQALISASAGSASLPVNDDAVTREFVVADDRSAKMYCAYFHEDQWKVIPYRTVNLEDKGSRLSDSHSTLPAKKIGIVGAGSLGSKIAVTLARSGVGSFFLVDDDIITPGNLVRHELDARSIGVHKVDGLEERIKAVASHATVTVRRVLLGGQESSGTTCSVLDHLASCDLIVDASASQQAFNFTAAAARNANTPMLWAEVYAGGIGGFVARVRPGKEPSPHSARRQFLAWCRSQDVPWVGDDRNYYSRQSDGPPLVADDTDVSVIAAHTSRMALDTLISSEESAFPHAAYVIGLRKAWIFTEPFDVRPINFTPEDEWASQLTPLQTKKAIQRIVSMLDRDRHTDRTGK